MLFIINRLCLSGYILHYRETGNLTKFLLIIGTDSQAVETASLCGSHPEWGIRIVGFLSHDPEDVGKKIYCHSIIGHTDDLPRILSEQVVDCVLLAGGISDLAQAHSLALRCEAEGIDFGLSASLINDRVTTLSTDRLIGLQTIFFKSVAQSPSKLFIKRLIDIALSSACIILLLPLWIIIPLIIKRDSPGPALYFHERVGRRGRRFIMYKFRTMVPGADRMQDRLVHLNEMDGPVFKIKDDPRFTGIGRFLRTTSIDELPQLFNVLKGDMSLVGPRPPIFKEVLQYQPWQKKRLSVIPGITCLWQVTGRNEIKFDEWMQLDLQYIENWSLTLDLKILLRTVMAVLSRRGAQ
jgi:exopolysaccharide biosynthesis polyprenyl glycosylphosphotransferase